MKKQPVYSWMRCWFMNHGDLNFKNNLEIEKDCNEVELHIGDWIEIIDVPANYSNHEVVGKKFKLILKDNEIKLRNSHYPELTPHAFWYMGKRCKIITE